MKNQRWIGVCLLFVGLAATAATLRVDANEGPRTVVVSAKRFEFSPKEITLKKGEPVKLQLTTDDVTHEGRAHRPESGHGTRPNQSGS